MYRSFLFHSIESLQFFVIRSCDQHNGKLKQPRTSAGWLTGHGKVESQADVPGTVFCYKGAPNTSANSITSTEKLQPPTLHETSQKKKEKKKGVSKQNKKKFKQL